MGLSGNYVCMETRVCKELVWKLWICRVLYGNYLSMEVFVWILVVSFLGFS